MFSTASPRPTEESQPLLENHNHDDSYQPSGQDRPLIWPDLPRHALEVTRGSLPGTTSLLLGLVPAAIVVGALQLNSIATSILNFFAIIPLSALVSHSSDRISNRVGQSLGALINATFGNAVELIVGCLALSHGDIKFAQAMMIGSVLSDILLVLGCCILTTSWGKPRAAFVPAIADTFSSLMIITAMTLILPTALYSTVSSSDKTDMMGKILTFSRGSAGVLLILYLLYLFFQFRTHSDLFIEADQEEDSTEEERPSSNADTSESVSAAHTLTAAIILFAAAACIMLCSHFLIHSIDDTAAAAHVTKRFIAAILMPIASNAPEMVAVIAASRTTGKTSYAIGVIVGSILQIVLMVIPLLVILGWIIQQQMTLEFETFQITILFFAVLMVTRILRDIEYTYLHGVMLIELYSVIAITFYIRPNLPDKSGNKPML